MARFFCPVPLAIGAEISLPETIAHHIHVVRLPVGESITLFNGEGGEYRATLTSIEKRRASAQVKTFSPREVELPYSVTIAQALPEGSKIDWIIEKAVELGAAAIQPIAAQRCVVKLAGDRAGKKLEHWRGIVSAAAEQSGRNRLMHVCEPADLNSWVAQQNLHMRIMLCPRAEQSLSNWARHHPPQAISLLIGPEGGFSEQEERAATDCGVVPLSIGPRVLRTETAALAALAALNAVWGEI
jgi:16S rRNA (uracil1498-N3)-methyltransferase